MRTLLTVLALLALTTIAQAQAQLQIRGGYGHSNLRTDSDLDVVSDQLESASVRAFGVAVELPLNEFLSFRPGLELNRRGTSLRLTEGIGVFGFDLPLGAEAKTRFTYVDVPLQLKATLPGQGKLRPYAFGGATLGYATGGNIRTTAQAIVEFNLMTTDIDLDAINYERFHAALAGGLGLDLRLSERFGAFVEGRFEQSLTQPYDVPVAAARTGFKAFNFGAGVSFAL